MTAPPKLRTCWICGKADETVLFRPDWRPKATFVCDRCMARARPVKAATLEQSEARYRLRRAERRWPRRGWPARCIGEPQACPHGGCESCLL